MCQPGFRTHVTKRGVGTGVNGLRVRNWTRDAGGRHVQNHRTGQQAADLGRSWSVTRGTMSSFLGTLPFGEDFQPFARGPPVFPTAVCT